MTPLVGLAALIGATILGCHTPETFHKNADAGFLMGSGGATTGSGGATVVGTGGATTSGSGGAIASTGGASASGGAPASGGSSFAGGGATGAGGATTGGAPGSGGAAGAGVGGTTVATGGAAGSATATGGRGTGGTAGTGAAGGAAAGGMAGDTSMTCTSCTLSLTYTPVGTADGNQFIAEVHVGTTTSVPINQISIKYWYTNETGTTDITTEVDYVGLSTGSGLTKPGALTTAAVSPAKTNANTVTTVTIPDTTKLTPGTELWVKFRIHATNFQGTFMLANDYSFGAMQNFTTKWSRITAYVGGVKAWGNEP